MTIRFNSPREAEAAYREDAAHLAQRGVINNFASSYLPESFKHNFNLAMDAQPALATQPNSGVPAYLTQWIDPAVYEILFSPNMAAVIFGEVKKGDWTTQTAFFPTVEHTGEVSSFGDFSENGHAGANTNWPQRQSYLFQTVKEYGELELERAGLAKISWVSEIDGAAALALNKFSNFAYFFGVSGLQNYGLLNDPNLTASLTPSTKASGGTAWITSSGAINATANEVYADIQAMFIQLVSQSQGLIDAKAKLTLALSPSSAVALTATNSFNVNVYDLLKKNFPNIRFETAVQYGQTSASNPQGIAAGNLVQMICDSVEGQDTGYCAFNEKMRAHPIIRGLSSFKQKVTAGTWGAIIRQPFAITSMLGV
jgi:hypothetical protein